MLVGLEQNYWHIYDTLNCTSFNDLGINVYGLLMQTPSSRVQRCRFFRGLNYCILHSPQKMYPSRSITTCVTKRRYSISDSLLIFRISLALVHKESNWFFSLMSISSLFLLLAKIYYFCLLHEKRWIHRLLHGSKCPIQVH